MNTIATMLGGIVGVYILTVLWEWALFKRINDDPVTGKLSATLAAYVTASSIAGFGMADGGPYYWGSFAVYLVPALVVAFIGYRRGLKLRAEANETAVETFG